jgi:hypothetical protein
MSDDALLGLHPSPRSFLHTQHLDPLRQAFRVAKQAHAFVMGDCWDYIPAYDPVTYQ